MKALSKYEFMIFFSPLKPRSYDFELPFYIPGHEKIPILTKRIKC